MLAHDTLVESGSGGGDDDRADGLSPLLVRASEHRRLKHPRA